MIEKEAPSIVPPRTRSLMDEILDDALAIQDRFVAEPMLKRTGRGVLKSRGVDGLQHDAEELRKKFRDASQPES